MMAALVACGLFTLFSFFSLVSWAFAAVGAERDKNGWVLPAVTLALFFAASAIVVPIVYLVKNF